jgi:hypothetical protein
MAYGVKMAAEYQNRHHGKRMSIGKTALAAICGGGWRWRRNGLGVSRRLSCGVWRNTVAKWHRRGAG